MKTIVFHFRILVNGLIYGMFRMNWNLDMIFPQINVLGVIKYIWLFMNKLRLYPKYSK